MPLDQTSELSLEGTKEIQGQRDAIFQEQGLNNEKIKKLEGAEAKPVVAPAAAAAVTPAAPAPVVTPVVAPAPATTTREAKLAPLNEQLDKTTMAKVQSPKPVSKKISNFFRAIATRVSKRPPYNREARDARVEKWIAQASKKPKNPKKIKKVTDQIIKEAEKAQKMLSSPKSQSEVPALSVQVEKIASLIRRRYIRLKEPNSSLPMETLKRLKAFGDAVSERLKVEQEKGPGNIAKDIQSNNRMLQNINNAIEAAPPTAEKAPEAAAAPAPEKLAEPSARVESKPKGSAIDTIANFFKAIIAPLIKVISDLFRLTGKTNEETAAAPPPLQPLPPLPSDEDNRFNNMVDKVRKQNAEKLARLEQLEQQFAVKSEKWISEHSKNPSGSDKGTILRQEMAQLTLAMDVLSGATTVPKKPPRQNKPVTLEKTVPPLPSVSPIVHTFNTIAEKKEDNKPSPLPTTPPPSSKKPGV